MAKFEPSQMMCHFCSIALVKVRPYSNNQRQKETEEVRAKEAALLRLLPHENL